MKKSELKLLQEKLQKVSQPPPPSKKRDDLSDELSKMFDDGTVLESEKRGTTAHDTSNETPATQATQTTQGSQRGIARRRASLPASAQQPIAPERDYMKVANSIHREAVPSGLFKGKSKLIYDYLYSRTRGAVMPTRTVQVSRREIMEKAGIGSDKTIRENLLHLRGAGLISWGGEIGAQGGNIYTVFLPEEALATQSTQGSQGTVGSPGQFLPTVPTAETTQGSQGLSVEGADTSGNPKTSFKTNTEKDDDEALALLRTAMKEATGREVPAKDLTELDELLTAEFKIAAGRTTVSSAPAFLAEHLRRRLWKKEKRQIETDAAEQGTVNSPKLDASKCPDCFGTGMWYPEGYEKGVAKCNHERMKQSG